MFTSHTGCTPINIVILLCNIIQLHHTCNIHIYSLSTLKRRLSRMNIRRHDAAIEPQDVVNAVEVFKSQSRYRAVLAVTTVVDDHIYSPNFSFISTSLRILKMLYIIINTIITKCNITRLCSMLYLLYSQNVQHIYIQ